MIRNKDIYNEIMSVEMYLDEIEKDIDSLNRKVTKLIKDKK